MDEKQIEVNYTFFLPDNKYEHEIFHNAHQYFSTLHEIHSICLHIRKYEDNPSTDKLKFAADIEELLSSIKLFDE